MIFYLLFVLPKNTLSFLTGKVLHIRLHPLLRAPIFRAYARLFRVNLEEVPEELSSYASLGAFFVRRLSDGCRTVSGDLVSPVDGRLREAGRVQDGLLPQIKGQSYSVESLIADAELAKIFNGGLFFNLYLSPGDYHHVHSPAEARITSARYIPGHLWPVNEWSLHNVEGVFARNERVVAYLETEWGKIALVMVGAFNVGRISVAFDTFETNQLWTCRSPGGFSAEYHPPRRISAGERLGTFHLGSSVVLLIEASSPLCRGNAVLKPSGIVYFGESLLL